MESCDVLIIGGGPAGSTCARKLRAAGLDVVILDKKTFPRDKTCAGWITPAVVEELELDTEDYARSRVFQPITGFRTGTTGGRVVENHYGHTISFGIRRCEFDHYLLERCGARLRLGEKLEKIERRGPLHWAAPESHWVINGEIEAPLLIGAGGHFCPVARHIGAAGTSSGKETVVAAQEIEFELSEKQKADCRVDAAVPELYFCPDLMGYAWCFRKGDFLNVGLGREDNTRLSEHVAQFAQWMKETGRIPHDSPEQFHGHAYILYGHSPRPLVESGVMLIGDAAGLAYAQSGEGIRPAVESGLIAASTITAAAGDYRRENLEPYERQIIARFGKREASAGASALLPEKIKQTIAGHLLASRWFSRHVVLDRWFLHKQQARLES